MKYRGKCMKCGGKYHMQDGGPKKCYDVIGNEIPCEGQEMHNASDNGQWMQVNTPLPPMANPQPNPLDMVHEEGTPNQFKVVSPEEPKPAKNDPLFGLLGASSGLAWLSGVVDRKRQNQYMQQQFAQLNQMNPMPTNDYQPNPYNLYSKYGGKLKTYRRGGGLSRSSDYGSKSHPYPSVDSSDFAGPHRSYPIPTRADAVDALRLAHLHGASDVIARVHAKYPDLKKGGRWIQGAVKHPGRCTPGSPNYDCPKGSPQWNLAQTFKKHHGFHRGKKK